MTRRPTAKVLVILALALPALAGDTRHAAGPPEGSPEDPLRDIEVEMRDGARLLTDLWLPPNADAPVPALLIRTPYGRHFEDGKARSWAARGYAIVVQAVRGRDGNAGTWLPWERDLEDGYDAIDWIGQQTWSNGRVGMTGGSYLGHTQILAAAAGHPGLACIVPLSPGSDGFSDVPFSGGILNISLIDWLYACRGPVLDLSGKYPRSANDRNLDRLPVASIDEAWAGFRSEIWQRWVSVETLADMPGLTVWDRLAEAEHKTPALHIDGLWDHESMATRRNWEQFGAHGGPHQYMVFGPWPHEPNQSTRYADVEYGERAVIDLNSIILGWYEHWLEAEPEGGPDLPHVQIFATGANRWLHLDEWPAAGATPRAFHVAGGRPDEPRKRKKDRAASLTAGTPDTPCTWDWTHDPSRSPSMSRDIHFKRTTRLWFSGDDPDALVLVTAPFEEDTLLTGPAELELALESSAVDTDLFALLVEVDAKGKTRALQRPAPFRARFREGFDRKTPLVSGVVDTVQWKLGNFAHVFAKGSRLGLALRSEWFPNYARNLGTLEPMATATRAVVQHNRIHSGPDHVSALRLFQIPLDRLEN